MNIIKKNILEKIKKSSGGIPLNKFIEICLFGKNGYYKNSLPIGQKGDFVTAPEISQLFGEILGIYIYSFWNRYFKCKFNLVELGPGNGTLVSDMLRITKKFNSFIDSIDLNLIEINNELIKLQKKNIFKSSININNVHWSDNFDNIKHQPSIIIANEFFDCFAIKQFIKINQQWYEKKINFNKKDNRLFIHNATLNKNNLIKKLNKLYHSSNNQIIEISDARKKYFNKICNFIKKNSGIVILFDYGYIFPINYSTLQSVSLNRKSNILDNPGKQDITSFVNFQDLVEIAKKYHLNIYGPVTQQEFLLNNGITERKNKIINNLSIKEKKVINKGYECLVSPDQMGNLFKCLIVSKYKVSNEK